MKIRKLVFILFPLIFYQCDQKDDYLITNNRVGNLKIGNSEKVILDKLHNYRIEPLDISSYKKLYNIYDSMALILSLEFFQEELWAIQVHSKKYLTKKNIGVGNTAQEVVNKGHKIWAITKEDLSLRTQTEEDDIYFYFEKKVTKSGSIGRNARMKSITIGHLFNAFEEIRLHREENLVLSQTNDSLFYSDLFDLELELPQNWSTKTRDSGIPRVKEMLFITDNNSDDNLLIIAQKITDKNIRTGLDYLSNGLIHLMSYEASEITNRLINSEPIQIANKDFYSLSFNTITNDSIRLNQIHWATIQNDYAVLITAKYYDSSNEKTMKAIVSKIKAHNKH